MDPFDVCFLCVYTNNITVIIIITSIHYLLKYNFRQVAVLKNEAEFYSLILTPSGRCRKMASLGSLGCLKKLEGNKYVSIELHSYYFLLLIIK